MFVHFTFEDGSNPFISTTNKKLFEMVTKYCLEQTGKDSFHVTGRAVLWTVHVGKQFSDYQRKQALLRNFAIEWQFHFCDYSWYQSEVNAWADFFREYGKKYGLLREFEENAII